MGLIWIICGPGRGRGKTSLASGLCEILPGSVRATCGRRSSAAEPPHCFDSPEQLHDFARKARSTPKHIVVDSDNPDSLNVADIRVFVDGRSSPSASRRNTAELKTGADIVVSTGTSAQDWHDALRGKLKPKALREAVCEALEGRKHRMPGSGVDVRSKVWLEAAGSHVFGVGLARLLENVDRMGTLQEAAKASKMSYRHAWDLIKGAEEHLGKTLVERRAGGNHGGGSTLCEDGRHFLAVFRQVSEEVAAFADKRFSTLYRSKNDKRAKARKNRA